MHYIVIDKSWLIGTPIERIIHVASDNILLMPAVLGHELFTTEDEAQKTRSWEKLKAVESKIYLIDHVGSLLSYEFENDVPCTPIQNRRYKIDFSFNSRLTKPDYPFTESQKKDIEYFVSEWETSKPKQFQEMVAKLHYWIPEVRQINPGSTQDEVEPIMKSLTNVDRIKQIYKEEFRSSSFPAVDKIDESWACFRWLQVWLMASVEYRRKFGTGEITTSNKRLANECIDMSYCITGILSGALATREKTMKMLFQFCRPDGILI